MKTKNNTQTIKKPAPNDADEIIKLKSGAKRSKKVAGEGKFPARFDLISTVALRRIAETYGEGSLKYGDDNWLQGLDEKNLLQHALAHLNQYRAGDESEDHLAHATWNLCALMHFQETRPDLMNLKPKGFPGR